MKPLLRRLLFPGAVAVVALAGAYAAGRAMAPTREMERIRLVTEARVDTDTTERREEKRTTVRRVVVEKLDASTGAVVERRLEDEHQVEGVAAAVETAARSEVRTEAERERIVERARASLRLRLDAGWSLAGGLSQLRATPDAWGLAGELRLVGPLWVGVGYERLQLPVAAEEKRTVHVVKASVAVEF